jgi:hypothetical protein
MDKVIYKPGDRYEVIWTLNNEVNTSQATYKLKGDFGPGFYGDDGWVLNPESSVILSVSPVNKLFEAPDYDQPATAVQKYDRVEIAAKMMAAIVSGQPPGRYRKNDALAAAEDAVLLTDALINELNKEKQ